MATVLHHGGVLELDASPLNTQPPSQWPRDLGSWPGYMFGLHTILDSQSINPSYISTSCI